jgi:hypothetical protein
MFARALLRNTIMVIWRLDFRLYTQSTTRRQAGAKALCSQLNCGVQ